MNCWPSGKYLIYCICTQYLVGAPFALITASIWRGMEVISCGTAEVVWKPRFLWQWPSGHLHCWSGCLSSFLLIIPHRFSMGFRSGEFAGQSSTVAPWSLNQLLVPLAVWGRCQGPAGKWNQHLHKSLSAEGSMKCSKIPGRWLRWLWTSETQWTNTKQMTWQPKSSLTVELHTGLQATWNLCLSTLPPDSGTLFSKWNAKFTFIWKEDFGPLSNSPCYFLHSPGKMLLTLSLVQKWLGSPFPEDVERGDSWCTDSSFSPLLVKLSQVFESAINLKYESFTFWNNLQEKMNFF